MLAQATPACIKETRTIQVKRGLWAPNFLSAVSMLRDVLSHRYEPMLLRKKGPHGGQSKKPRAEAKAERIVELWTLFLGKLSPHQLIFQRTGPWRHMPSGI